MDTVTQSFDQSKFYLGKRCPRFHEWGVSGQSLRRTTTRSCVECQIVYQRNYEQKNRDYRRARDLRLRGGCTLSLYNELLNSQNGCCAICRKPPVGKRLAVDHCHASGQVRGLLCAACNTALGLFEDETERLRQAEAYLRRTNTQGKLTQ